MAKKKESLKLICVVLVCVLTGVAGLKCLEHLESRNGIISESSVTATLIINFENAVCPYQNGNKTIWRYKNNYWHTYTQQNNNRTVWVFENISTKNASVYGFLIEASKLGNFGVEATYWEGYDSMLVNSIANVQNGKNNKYWQYWVNGKYGEVGCDKKQVENNDVIEWRFTGEVLSTL